MKLFIVCSKHFYDRIPPIEERLLDLGHAVTLPNSYEDPFCEDRMKELGSREHLMFKQSMMRLHEPKIKSVEGLLVLNFNKGEEKNYIGGATFMEIVKAWELNKKIFLYNPIPENIFRDELL